ncbi:MAG: proton-conducting transporter transmembrane domain-containing protein [Candidatus Dormibacteria bacterium]
MISLALLGSALLALSTVAAVVPRLSRLALSAQALAVGLGGVAAAAVMLSGNRLGAPFGNGIHPAVGLDPLSAFFLLVLTATAVPALIFASRYLADHPRRRALGPLTGMFVAAMALVLIARDVSSFLAGWELMTLIPAAAILVHRSDRDVRHAVFVYLAITHLGGTGVWLVMILLSNAGALGHPAAFALVPAALRWAIWVVAIIGFGTKAGIAPMHSWLPRAHPVAPAHISALMSGVMVKVALYGLIRVMFVWTGHVPAAIAIALLALGALSALAGVLYALFQHELKRLLAFHTIENVGIIALGLGASLLFASSRQPLWAALALAAALLHTLNHAVFKSLLFLGAGAIERATHSQSLDHMGGLLRRMPWTAWAFLVGAMAIAGLPPLNGFASEWLTLQSLLHLAFDRASAAWVGPLAAAALAATAALAVLCFVKVVGLVLLGPPRQTSAAEAHDPAWSMRTGPAVLAALCVLLGIVPGLVVPRLSGLIGGHGVLAESVTLAPPGTGGLPTPALAVALPLLVMILVALRRRRPAAAPSPTWACGQALEPSLLWTSSAFTKPLRLTWEAVLRPRREVIRASEGGVVQSVTYRGQVPHLFDTLLYAPALRVAVAFAGHARRLQSGHLRTYGVYLGGVLFLLLLLARVGLLH